MPIIPPPAITPVPTPVPQRGDRATFSDRVDAFVTWLEDAPPEFEAAAANVENNATMAQTFATNASNSATAASTSASNAATSATNAATSATSASGFASAAATSATNAATSESNAAASAAAAAAMAAAFTGTSSTSVTIGTGAKTFTTQTGEQYTTGVTLSLVSQANVANFMIGQVTGYNSGTGQLNMNITVTGGSGTFADWNISLAGVQGPTGPQGPAGNLSGGNLTGALNELKAPNIPAAATTDVWALAGNSATLTGTTTITSFGTAPQAGSKRTLIAAAITPITNSANLVLPGGLNYTTAVGDRLEIFADTTTQHRVSIWKADGTPVVAAGTISSVGSVITNNTTLTAASPGYQPVQMAGQGRSVTLPAANTLNLGGPRFQIDNSAGQYPAGVRDNAGTLIGVVGVGGNALLSVKDNSNAAGAWGITGEGLEPGMVTIDADLPSGYDTANILPQFAALDDNVSIHFAMNASGHPTAFVVDHTGKVVSTPVTMFAGTGKTVCQAFRISATQAIVFFGDPTTHHALVLTLTGSSPSYSLSVGTAAILSANYGTAWGGENARAEPKIAQLSPTLYVFTGITGTNSVAHAISVSGSTVTIGAASTPFFPNSLSATTYPLTATTALHFIKHGSGAPYTNSAIATSISGTTVTAGAAVNTGVPSSVNTAPCTVLLSPTKALLADDLGNAGQSSIAAITVSGTSLSSGGAFSLDSSTTSMAYTSNNAGRYNPHLWRTGPNSAGFWNVASATNITRITGVTESAGSISVGSSTALDSAIQAQTPSQGQMLPQGTASYLGLKYVTPGTAGGGLQLVSGAISGNSVTKGYGKAVRDAHVDVPSSYRMARNANGDVLLLGKGTTNVIGPAEVVVARAAANQPVVRGKISIPEMTDPTTGAPSPVANVSANRFVIMGIGLGQQGTLPRPKVISLELAA